MKPKYCVEFSHSSTGKQSHFVGLTESQLVSTVLEQGVHRVLSITHDDQGPRDIRQVEGTEMISIWKEVYRMIRKKKHHAR